MTSPSCCGPNVIDATTQYCCSNRIYTRKANEAMGCCGSRVYNPSTHICCGCRYPHYSRLHQINKKAHTSHPYYCGNTTYHNRDNRCCGNSLVAYAFFHCCGEKGWNQRTHICCQGVLVRKAKDSWGESCCGMEPYTVDQSCCGGKILNYRPKNTNPLNVVEWWHTVHLTKVVVV